MKRNKSKKNGTGAFSALLRAVGFFLVCFLSCALVLSGIGYFLPSPTAAAPLLGLAAVVVTGAVGGFFERRLCGEKTVPLLAALTFTLLLLAAGLIGSDGKLPLASLLSSAAAFPSALIGVLFGKERRRRHR